MSARNGTNNRRKGARTKLANIVRQETRDGKLIVRFLVDAMQGNLDGAKPHHRLDAARQLLAIGFDGAQAFIDHNTPDAHPRAAATSRAANDDKRRLDPKLAKLIRQQTDNGKTAVRFLVDVMQGKLPDFKPHHRLAAARELLHRGFYDDRGEDPDDYYRDRRPSRRPRKTAKKTAGDRKDDTRNGWRSRRDLLVQKHYGSKDTLDKTVENTVYGKIEFEDRETFEDLTDQQVEALVQQYGSTEAWFAAVAKFANAEATLEQLLSGSIDPDDTTNANADDDTNAGDGESRGDPHADDSYAPQEEPPPEEPPPEEPPPEDDEHRPDPGEPSIWDLKAANRVLDSTTAMVYYR